MALCQLQISHAAPRLGLTAEQLSAALLQYAAANLNDSLIEQENGDPGSWVAGGAAPDWLLPHLPLLLEG